MYHQIANQSENMLILLIYHYKKKISYPFCRKGTKEVFTFKFLLDHLILLLSTLGKVQVWLNDQCSGNDLKKTSL